MAIDPALARIYTSAPNDDQFFETLEISHPAFTQTHYLTTAPTFTGGLESGVQVEFIQFPFRLQPPDASGQGPGQLAFSIDNVDQQIGLELERASAQSGIAISLVWRVYVESNLIRPATDPVALEVRDVQVDVSTVSAQAIPYDAVNRRWPSVLFDTRLFPGLDR